MASVRLLPLDVTESTNSDALDAAKAGDPGGLWVVADEQTGGRGRQERQWVSPPGNLYASLLLIDPCALRYASQLSFVAAVALYDAIAAVTGLGASRLTLKWPNDVLLDGAKVSGILLEAHQLDAGKRLAIVIGIGVNVVSSPSSTPYPTAFLNTVAPYLTRDDLFLTLAQTFETRLGLWQETQSGSVPEPLFAPIRKLWLERAHGIGGAVTIRLSQGEKQGIFIGIAQDGRLELQTDHGVELIDAGDLFFPSAGSK